MKNTKKKWSNNSEYIPTFMQNTKLYELFSRFSDRNHCERVDTKRDRKRVYERDRDIVLYGVQSTTEVA